MNGKRASPRRAPGPGKYDRSRSAAERRREQRTRLLVAAAQVLAEQGLAGTTVDRIVRRVSMSRRTFYEHFRDVSHALLEVLEGSADLLYQRVAQALAAEADPAAKLVGGLRAYLESMASFASLSRALYTEIPALGPRHGARLDANRERFLALWTAQFAEAFRQGLIPTLPDEATHFALVAGVEATALRYIKRGEEARLLEAVQPLATLAGAAILIRPEDVLGQLRRTAREGAPRRATVEA